MPYNPDSEDALELALLPIFAEFGWQTVRAFDEAFSPETAAANRPWLGRANRGEVVLRARAKFSTWNGTVRVAVGAKLSAADGTFVSRRCGPRYHRRMVRLYSGGAGRVISVEWYARIPAAGAALSTSEGTFVSWRCGQSSQRGMVRSEPGGAGKVINVRMVRSETGGVSKVINVRRYGQSGGAGRVISVRRYGQSGGTGKVISGLEVILSPDWTVSGAGPKVCGR